MDPPRRAFRFERLLAGDRWARDVRVEVDTAGRIASLETDGAPDGCETVTGWAVPGVPNVHSHSFQRALAAAGVGEDLVRLSVGLEDPDDLLDDLDTVMSDASICGLGHTAASAVGSARRLGLLDGAGARR